MAGVARAVVGCGVVGGGLDPEFRSLCSGGGAARAPAPPRSGEFFIMCH